ncbi:MAG: cache domain-containing protein [Spirochaetales bacterium]|nr:cache domain-containing protein [Spirochaetales bacterium]
MEPKIRYWKIRDKILLSVALSMFSLLFILVSLNTYNLNQQGHLNVSNYREDMIEEVRDKLQNIVETAKNIAEYYYQQALVAGSSPRAQQEAQTQAKAIISAMRYQNEEGYIWINDTSQPFPRMVMHPINPELNGQILNDPKYNTANNNTNLFTVQNGKHQ